MANKQPDVLPIFDTKFTDFMVSLLEVEGSYHLGKQEFHTFINSLQPKSLRLQNCRFTGKLSDYSILTCLKVKFKQATFQEIEKALPQYRDEARKIAVHLASTKATEASDFGTTVQQRPVMRCFSFFSKSRPV